MSVFICFHAGCWWRQSDLSVSTFIHSLLTLREQLWVNSPAQGHYSNGGKHSLFLLLLLLFSSWTHSSLSPSLSLPPHPLPASLALWPRRPCLLATSRSGEALKGLQVIAAAVESAATAEAVGFLVLHTHTHTCGCPSTLQLSLPERGGSLGSQLVHDATYQPLCLAPAHTDMTCKTPPTLHTAGIFPGAARFCKKNTAYFQIVFFW